MSKCLVPTYVGIRAVKVVECQDSALKDTQTPWLMQIRFTQISLTRNSKNLYSSLNTYYETEIPPITRISHQVINN